MAKISNKYLKVDPFKIIEDGYPASRNQVSESIFSLANEYMGVRGIIEESDVKPSLIGCYFNGIYEYALSDTPSAYKGIVKRTHFTINSVNFLKVRLFINDEELVFSEDKIADFYRELDMHNGLLKRRYTYKSKYGKIHLVFTRLVNMEKCHETLQHIEITSEKDVEIKADFYLDSTILHWGSDCYWKKDKEFKDEDYYGLAVKTLTTKQSLVSLMSVQSKATKIDEKFLDKEVIVSYKINASANKTVDFTRYVINIADCKSDSDNATHILEAKEELKSFVSKGYQASIEENKKYFDKVWENSDIIIDGSEEDQQGIRFCIFQLEQTYHGYSKENNIGAKGLTGEAYSGHAFWDSETYCLPYYLFSNKKAAMNLLMFRYNTLQEAKTRAKELDCTGACYPIATRNGKEACNLWQHASCQFQPSTGVSYAIFHYMNLYNDEEFMQKYGLEMILEISKFLLSRGQYNSDHSKFGYYGVMGPDEFSLMVNHNTYTNYMAKKTFDYLFELIDSNKYQTKELFEKCGYDDKLLKRIKEASEKMVILYDQKTNLFEQHEGYFNMPHVDIDLIPTSEFPLYSHWSYDRIYRNDMIKQPDVLMFMFLYSSSFSYEMKKANYEYYEPRCIHESSLSPSIHSIFACELDKEKEALDFFSFATRLDLDDYNCNTSEGIHTTSIAAAWMNIVYGFGGLRSDGKELVLNPMLPSVWNHYSFKLVYLNTKLHIDVYKEYISISITGSPITIVVYGKEYKIGNTIRIDRGNYVLSN